MAAVAVVAFEKVGLAIQRCAQLTPDRLWGGAPVGAELLAPAL